MAKTSNQNADRFNPNNPAFKAAADHNSNIHNPNSGDYKAIVANKAAQALSVQPSNESEQGGKSIQAKP